ncbi:MAG TPA: transposase [Sedimentisphaerales bacterium]|nr:transposase [Sedimentisphaerales bacterium]
MTVVADYFTGRVIWMGKDRNKRTLDEFFDGMSEQQKEAVEAVTMDMCSLLLVSELEGNRIESRRLSTICWTT